jgi:hypothetical protein
MIRFLLADDSDRLAQKLDDCARDVVRTSLLDGEQAPYTDIGGAIALATEEGRSVTGAT